MSRDRYAIARLFSKRLHAYRWVVLDNDFDRDSDDRCRLSDYTFDTAEDAATFCRYLNERDILDE